MDVEHLLRETLELTEYQVLVYLSLLEKTGTAGQLFKRLNMNRATLYRVLDELTELNLVIKKQIKTRMFFEAMHPASLTELYQRRKVSFEEKGRQLEKAVYDLLRKASAQPSDASITIEKGIYAHYRRMKLELTCKEKIIRQKTGKEEPLYHFREYPEIPDYDKFVRSFVKERVTKEIHIKLLTHFSSGLPARAINQSNPEHLKIARVLPSELVPDIGLTIFDDFTIFTLREEKPEATVVITIRNEVTASFMKTLFDFVFERSIESYQSAPISTFKTNQGFTLPHLGIGTSGIGGYWNGAHPYVDDIGDTDQIRHALSKGMRYIDTCLLYGDGHAVEIVQKAIKNIQRDTLFINGKLTSFDGGTLKNIKEIEEQCDKYLKMLHVDYLDQFQIHSPKRLGDVPQNEVIQKIGELITAGKVKHWGVSNYSTAQLKEAMSVIREPLLSNEIPFGLFAREYEENGTLDYMHSHHITTIAYFSVKRGGFLADTLTDPIAQELLSALWTKYRKTPVQIALNWVISHQQTMAIVKTANGTHVNENIGALGWRMNEEEYAALSALKMIS